MAATETICFRSVRIWFPKNDIHNHYETSYEIVRMEKGNTWWLSHGGFLKKDRPNNVFFFHSFWLISELNCEYLNFESPVIEQRLVFEVRTKLEPFSIFTRTSQSGFIRWRFNTGGGWRTSWFRRTPTVYPGRWGLCPREVLVPLPRGRCASARDQRPDPHGCHGLHGGEHEHGRYRRYTSTTSHRVKFSFLIINGKKILKKPQKY